MKLFGTEYTQPPWPGGHGGWVYLTQLWARGREHALGLMAIRGLGERFNDFSNGWEWRASYYLRRMLDARVRDRPRLGNVMHALTHVAHLAVSSGTCTPEDALGDSGWLHEAIHRICWTKDDTTPNEPGIPPWKPYWARVAAVEERIPGYLHPHGKWGNVVGWRKLPGERRGRVVR